MTMVVPGSSGLEQGYPAERKECAVRRLTSVAATGAAVIGLAWGLAACGGGSSSSSSTTTSTTNTTRTTAGSATTGGGATTITIQNFAYRPATITVKAGSTITVKNQDSATHTVTADNNAFDTGNISGGATKTMTAPSTPGSFPYHCTIHPFMHGTLTVT